MMTTTPTPASRGPGEPPPAPQDEGSDQACTVLAAMANWNAPADLPRLQYLTNLSITTLALVVHGLAKRGRIVSAADAGKGPPWMLSRIHREQAALKAAQPAAQPQAKGDAS